MVFLMNRARHDHQDNLAESYQDQDQAALLAGSGSFRSSRRVSVACPEGLMPERWQRWRIQLIPLLPDASAGCKAFFMEDWPMHNQRLVFIAWSILALFVAWSVARALIIHFFL
jgi:hypothetical protein